MWFATNAVIADLEASLALQGTTAWLTGAVQIGFIAGTAVLSVSGLADRYSPRYVFFTAALFAAVANAATLGAWDFPTLVAARFLCGVALAGVYPIGMKVAASWYDTGLGSALGWLVGALVLGTAFPHLLRAMSSSLPWTAVVLATSTLALVGGLVLLGVAEGPHLRTTPRFDRSAVPRLWRLRSFRSAVLGYLGHMWELYALWAMLPAFVVTFTTRDPNLVSFGAIGAGAVGCVGGGWLAQRWGSLRVSRLFLGASAVCCLVAPFVWGLPEVFVLALLGIWGVVVVGDSPQLSALSARAAPPELVGTGLALATSLGFALTVLSLAVVDGSPLRWVPWLLLPGPVLGWLALRGFREL